MLGDFNDYAVQRDELEAYADELTASGRADASTLLAMGRVSERLRVRSAEARARFGKRFERFASPETRRRYRAVFAPGHAGRAKK